MTQKSIQLAVVTNQPERAEMVDTVSIPLGWQVHANSGHMQPLKWLFVQAVGESLDAVLVDLDLPNAEILIAELSVAQPNLPILVMARYERLVDLHNVLLAGATDFVAIPLNPEHFTTVVERAISKPSRDSTLSIDSSTSAAPNMHPAESMGFASMTTPEPGGDAATTDAATIGEMGHGAMNPSIFTEDGNSGASSYAAAWQEMPQQEMPQSSASHLEIPQPQLNIPPLEMLQTSASQPQMPQPQMPQPEMPQLQLDISPLEMPQAPASQPQMPQPQMPQPEMPQPQMPPLEMPQAPVLQPDMPRTAHLPLATVPVVPEAGHGPHFDQTARGVHGGNAQHSGYASQGASMMPPASVPAQAAHRQGAAQVDPSLTSPHQISKRLIAVVGLRGGVGRSTIAVNLAMALQQQELGNITLMEAHHGLSHLSLMLHLHPRNTLAGLSNVPTLDLDIMQGHLQSHGSGINVLAAPSDLDELVEISGERWAAILSMTQELSPIVIADSSATTDEALLETLVEATDILVVMNPEIASLRSTTALVNNLYTEADVQGTVHVVLNRAGVGGGLDVGTIRKQLGHEMAATLPDDPSLVTYAMNRGIPFVNSHPRSLLTKRINGLATQIITGTQAPEEEKKSARSLLPFFNSLR